MSVLRGLDRLPVRLTAAFLLASVVGVALVAILAYRTTSSDFSSFVGHLQMMRGMMGDQSIAEA